MKPHSGNGGANPATLNCLDVEGQLRIEQTPQAQDAICVLAEWTLLKHVDVTQNESLLEDCHFKP